VRSSGTLEPSVSARDHAQGSANAFVTLVEFGDYQCPFCGAAHLVVKELQRTRGENLRFVYRNFPITAIHPLALVAAEAAEAAALYGKFWEMHDQLLENQNSLDTEVLVSWAQQIGLDVRKFLAADRLAEVTRRIKEDRRSAIASGVNGTPCFFVNGSRFDGPPTYDSLLRAIEEADLTA
jgi:protein-disulfide isomerase